MGQMYDFVKFIVSIFSSERSKNDLIELEKVETFATECGIYEKPEVNMCLSSDYVVLPDLV